MAFSLSQLTAKAVRLAVKNHTGLKLCEKYNCTEEELFSAIGRIFSKDETELKKIIRALQKNPNKGTWAAKNLVGQTETTENQTQTDQVEKQNPDSETMFAELVARESTLSSDVMQLENAYQEKVGGRRGLRDGMAKILEQLSALKESAIKLGLDYDEILSAYNALGEEINRISEERRKKLGELGTVRANILGYKKVLLIVTSDIEISEAKVPFEMDDSGAEELFSFLSDDELCQDLTVREVRLLARVLKIMEHAKQRQVDILFESDNLQAAYELIIERDYQSQSS